MFSNLFIQSIKLEEKIPCDNYLSTLPVIKNLVKITELTIKKPVTFFVGENGTGKSTLLEALAACNRFNAEGGTINFKFSTQKTHSDLCDYLTLCKGIKHPKDGFFLRAESFYNVASNIDAMDNEPSFSPKVIESYGGISLHEQSHGESFLSLVKNRFGGNGLYILDEPEAALSPSRQLTLLSHINELVKKDSQFIIATHSPILLAYPNADIYVLSDDAITLTSFKETEHYQLTKQFLNNPEQYIKYLFEQ